MSRNIDGPKTPLPRPKPSPQFLSTGPTKNATSRRRIAAAGRKIAAKNKWPSYERVMKLDPRVKLATLGRNSDALDEARSAWVSGASDRLAQSGEFPTLERLRIAAGVTRTAILARFEPATADARRRWVEKNGAHPEWSEDAEQQEPLGPPDGETENRAQRSAASAEMSQRLKLAEDRVTRLLAERKSDRAKIKQLQAELAEAQEIARRALLGVQTKHAVQLNQPSASTRV